MWSFLDCAQCGERLESKIADKNKESGPAGAAVGAIALLADDEQLRAFLREQLLELLNEAADQR